QILEEGKDPVTAEPLYVLLALAGHPDAHEQARILAREARIQGKTLAKVIREDRSLDAYFRNLTPEQRRVLGDPAEYRGASAMKTLEICKNWEKRLSEI